MAIVLKDKWSDDHSCMKELPGELRYKYWGISDNKRIGIESGVVARCSCGELWQTRKDIVGTIYWGTPGLINYWKYRNSGRTVEA